MDSWFSGEGPLIPSLQCGSDLGMLKHILFVCSDGVLNPSGVRFGSAEIYSVLEDFAKIIDDAICVGQRRPQDKDERVLLFLKLRPNQKCTPDLLNSIRSKIKTRLSARHVPAFIFEVSEIPVSA